MELSIFRSRLLAMVEHHGAPDSDSWYGFRVALEDGTDKPQIGFNVHWVNQESFRVLFYTS